MKKIYNYIKLKFVHMQCVQLLQKYERVMIKKYLKIAETLFLKMQNKYLTL